MKRDLRVYIEDILESIMKIEEGLLGSFSTFKLWVAIRELLGDLASCC